MKKARLALVALTLTEIHRLLKLPEEIAVVSFREDSHYNRLVITLEGPDFPEMERDYCLPLSCIYYRTVTTAHDEVVFDKIA